MSNEPLLLVIEDNEFIRKIIAGTLTGKNYLFAKDGKEALSIYKSSNPQIVFLDLNLPDIKGMDLFKEIKQINNKAFVVIISADNSNATVISAIQSGVAGYIAKPFSRAIIEQYIEKYKHTLTS